MTRGGPTGRARGRRSPPGVPRAARTGITALLRRMHDVVASEATPQERLDQLTAIIARHVAADVCSIYLRRSDDKLELYSTEGLKPEAVHQTVMAQGEGLVGKVCDTGAPLVTADAPLHPAFSYRPETGEDPLHSFLGVPLLRSGKALGVLVLQNRKSRKYEDDEIEAAQAVATLLAEIAASGELLDESATQQVGAMLRLPERRRGVGVVDGVAIGHVWFIQPPTPKHNVFSRDPEAEANRIDSGVEALRASLDKMLVDANLGEEPREVLETYRLLAADAGWRARMRDAALTGLTAESAVERIQSENRGRLSQARDPYLRERLHDLDDLTFRLLRHLSNEPSSEASMPDDAIAFARSLGPAALLEFDRAKLKGLVLAEGATTSHVAIVARALGLPLVAGAGSAIDAAEEGDEVAIDGEEGVVFLRPTPDVVTSFREKIELRSERQAAFARERELPATTKDGVDVEIHINAGLTLDMEHLENTGANGVGLFRTELQFLIGSQLPRVRAQQRLYADVLERAAGRPVVFRTADLGADKSAEYMVREIEGNPAMGWRGLRMAVDRPGILRPQLRALLGAAVGEDLYILFPMVTTANEMIVARALLDKEISIRTQRGVDLPRSVSVGAMVETPAAGWRAAQIARHVDFFSIGGNDLAQFYFAADRNAARTQERYDPLDAGFLSFIGHIVEQADAAGKPLSYCGEQAADPIFAAALMSVGIRKFSLPPTAVGGFRRLVRSVRFADLAAWRASSFDVEDGQMRRSLALLLRSKGAEINASIG
ncbi:MAG: phosphoenolpyruvate--protein phosphotransferase [Alphaproteobacteria bacterium]|nr:phosphoenolpyruvate--protein phosphotransferase [Alphaproteobacteria bacterium]